MAIDKLIEHIAQVSMVIFPVSPYFNQYLKLKHTNQGFSLHVCGGLMLSNIFKIFFWYCKRFDVTILVQGITMFAVQLWLLAASKSTIRIKRHFPYNDVELLGLFFYLYILAFQLIALLVCQFEWSENPLYVETIGFSGVALEAAVPGFQVFRNFRNRSVKGFSELVLLVWFTGDICKIGYHLYFGNPIQFVLCGIVQVTFDLILFYQFYKYSKAFFDLNKDPDEQRRLLSEDPNDYCPPHSGHYDYPSSSNQFEAKPSHQRFLTEGTIHENAYDEAVMEPKPKITSKSLYEESNASFSSMNANNTKGKNLAIDIQNDNDDCPQENDNNSYIHNVSFNESLNSFRSYQYANIRNSNYHYFHHHNNNNNGNNNNEQYDAINFILNMKNKVRSLSISNNNNNGNSSINGNDNNSNIRHDINRRNSSTTFNSYNSSIFSNDPSFIFESYKSTYPESILDNNIIPSTINKGLNRSKSVQFPNQQFKQIDNTGNNSYHSTLPSIQRSNSQLNSMNYSRNQRTNNL
ncbi:hypothetical protein U3516DRAFT_609226 [Neocallimastix sp. 'constans']|jgi:hypothetical protein